MVGETWGEVTPATALERSPVWSGSIATFLTPTGKPDIESSVKPVDLLRVLGGGAFGKPCPIHDHHD
jgi:hypothetical protein